MPYAVSTLADLQALMAQRWDQVVFWTPEEARLALNESLREWNLLTGRWRTRVQLALVANEPEVPLPGSMTYGMRVTTATGAPLTPSSLLELDLGRPSWRLETTATGGDVPSAPLLWAPLSLTRIAIWPASAAPLAPGLLLDGVLRTPVLVNPTDTVNLGEEIVDIVADMALHVAAFKEAGDRWRATRPYFEVFLQAAADENGLLKQSQAYRRWAGLDRRRDLQPTAGATNQIQGVATEFSRHDQGDGGGLVIDRDLLTELQDVLIEPPDGGDTWPSLIWSRDEVLEAVNGACRSLVRDTHLTVERTELPITAGTTSIALPVDWLATGYLVWRAATGRRTPLGPVDGFEGDLAMPGWETTASGLPLGYADLDGETLTLRLVPTPAESGTLELLYIAVPSLVTGALPGTDLPLAEEFTSAVKYASLGWLLRKVGRLIDPERAQYCERRYDLTRTAASIILAGWS